MLAPRLLPEKVLPELTPTVEAPPAQTTSGQQSAPSPQASAPEESGPQPSLSQAPSPSIVTAPTSTSPPPTRTAPRPEPVPTQQSTKSVVTALPPSSPTAVSVTPQKTSISGESPTPKTTVPSTLAPQATTKTEVTARRTSFLVAAVGTPNPWKSFWEGAQETSYSIKVAKRGAERLARLKPDARMETLSDSATVTSLMKDKALRQQRCRTGGFTALAIYTVRQPQVVISRTDSAYWPELSLILHDCKEGESSQSTSQLAPRNADRFPFDSDLSDSLDRQFKERL